MNSDVEIYPMPMFATLAVSDVERSTEWYEEALGFKNVFGMPTMAHLRYRKYGDVLLVSTNTDLDPDQRRLGVDIHFTTEAETVAVIADRARAADAVVNGPEETPYNTREVTIEDPDGYTLVFSEPVDTSRSFEDVMGEGFKE
jgi:catechol 2,3-dioxygenase-like lactoylglutathione lyase family enzyme